MKGVFNTKPPVKPRSKMKSWDIDIAFDYMTLCSDNKVMDLSDLAGKLCLLVLMSRMCRIGELGQLDLEHMDISEGSVCFPLPVPTKTFTTGSRNAYSQGLQKLTLKRFPNPAICPVEALYTYLKCTLPFRVGMNKVFLIVDQSPRPASRQTLSRWTKTILNKAEFRNFTVHSGRSAPSTCTLLLGLPIDSILKQAGWKSKSTFVKYYMNSPLIKSTRLEDKHNFSKVWSDTDSEKLKNHEDEQIKRFKDKHDSITIANCSLTKREQSPSTSSWKTSLHQSMSLLTQNTSPYGTDSACSDALLSTRQIKTPISRTRHTPLTSTTSPIPIMTTSMMMTNTKIPVARSTTIQTDQMTMERMMPTMDSRNLPQVLVEQPGLSTADLRSVASRHLWPVTRKTLKNSAACEPGIQPHMNTTLEHGTQTISSTKPEQKNQPSAWDTDVLNVCATTAAAPYYASAPTMMSFYQAAPLNLMTQNNSPSTETTRGLPDGATSEDSRLVDIWLSTDNNPIQTQILETNFSDYLPNLSMNMVNETLDPFEKPKSVQFDMGTQSEKVEIVDRFTQIDLDEDPLIALLRSAHALNTTREWEFINYSAQQVSEWQGDYQAHMWGIDHRIMGLLKSVTHTLSKCLELKHPPHLCL